MPFVHGRRNKVVPIPEGRWHVDAQKALDKINHIKQDFRAKAREVERKPMGQKKIKGKLKYRIVGQKRALRETGLKLKTAKRKFNEQVDVQAKRRCRSLCKKMSDKLPRELRNLIYDNMITENNATFYNDPDGRIKLVNGCSPFQHCFDTNYTGCAMHTEIVEELNHKGIRFDFRHSHALLRGAFTEYVSFHNFDLAKVIERVGVTLNISDLKGRELIMGHFKALFELHRGAHIHVFIEPGGKTQHQLARSFTSAIRSIVVFLGRLKEAGYKVTVVMNPSYMRSNVKNHAESRFSIIHSQDFRYSFTLRKHEYSATGIEHKLQAYFDNYGDTWAHRLNP